MHGYEHRNHPDSLTGPFTALSQDPHDSLALLGGIWVLQLLSWMLTPCLSFSCFHKMGPTRHFSWSWTVTQMPPQL